MSSRIQRTKISEDCPAFFFNPHKATNYDFTAPRPSFTRTMAKKSEMGNESCFVLPGGESVLAATMKSRKSHADGRKSYRIYDYDGKRVSESSLVCEFNWTENDSTIFLFAYRACF